MIIINMTIDIDEVKVKRNEFGLWFAWTLATALGMLIGYLPLAFLVGPFELGIARVIVPIIAGTLLGLAQWLVLRPYVIEILRLGDKPGCRVGGRFYHRFIRCATAF